MHYLSDRRAPPYYINIFYILEKNSSESLGNQNPQEKIEYIKLTRIRRSIPVLALPQ